MKKIDWKKLGLSLGACFLAAGIGSLVTFSAIPTWYASLEKPVFNPPSSVFGPVWTTLYFLMGIALYLVWTNRGKSKEKKKAFFFFQGQLVLNVLWSIIFFGLKMPFFAFVEIIILWFFIFFTIAYFLRISKTAGVLLFPYLLWVSFASILNFFIFFLNA